ARLNAVSKEIGTLLAQGKTEEAETRKQEAKKLREGIPTMVETGAATGPIQDEQRRELLLRLPNLPHANVALGKSSADNPLVRTHGEPAKFDFKPKGHVE